MSVVIDASETSFFVGPGQAAARREEPLRMMGGIPKILEPEIATVRVVEPQDPGEVRHEPVVEAAVVDPPAKTAYYLPRDGVPTPDVPETPLLRVASADIWSQSGPGELAEALKTGVMQPVLGALGDGMVFVPAAVKPSGELVTRLFGSHRGRSALCFFSSIRTLTEFLGDDENRLFTAHIGLAIFDYMADHYDDVGFIVFDPGDEHSMTITPRAMHLLTSASRKIEAERAVEAAAELAKPVVGFHLGTSPFWREIDLTLDDWERQIDPLVGLEAEAFGDRDVLVHWDNRVWLATAGRQALEIGADTLVFRVSGTSPLVTALTISSCFHTMGAEVDGVALIDRVERRVLGEAWPEDQILRIATAGGPMIRHTRIRNWDMLPSHEIIPLKNIDYWLIAPDGSHAAQVCVTTPYTTFGLDLSPLTDNLVLNSRWIRA